MGESRVMAVSIGFALAGVAVVALLAGWTFRAGERLTPIGQLDPIVQASPAGGAIGEEPQVASASVPRRSRVEPTPEPTPQAPVLAPQRPSAQPSVAQADQAEQSVDRSGRFTRFWVGHDIRTVDFLNEFTYPVAGIGPVTVVNGSAPTDDQGTAIDLHIDRVIYGDVTRDGQDDAIVEMHFTDQWGSLQPMVRVFSISDDYLEDWGTSWVEYRSSGGFESVSVDQSVITISSWTANTQQLSTVMWETQGPHMGLNRIEALPSRLWVDLGADNTVQLETVPGALRAVVAVDAASGGTFSFGADAGWMLRVTERNGGPVTLRVRHEATGRLVGDATPDQSLQLAGADRYQAEVISAPSDATFEIEATDQRTMLAPKWETRSEIQIVEQPARREVRLSWPEFTSAAGVADLAAVNATIASFIDSRLQNHAQAVTACDADEPAILDLDYHLTLVSYDLVSINFIEFVCLCQSGDAYEVHPLTIDANTGELIDAASIIDVRDPTLQQVWLEQAIQQNYWIDDDYLAESEPILDTTATVSLHPDGVWVTGIFLHRGAEVPMPASLSFEQLDGLIDPAIALRSQSGSAVALPVEEGCGC